MTNRKFRGKAIETENWVEGSYYFAELSKQHFILKEIWVGNCEFIRVIPETVELIVEKGEAMPFNIKYAPIMDVGILLIAKELERLIKDKEYTESDTHGELADAAACYAMTDDLRDFIDRKWVMICGFIYGHLI